MLHESKITGFVFFICKNKGENVIYARKTNDLIIYFVDKRTICIQQGQLFTYFHRWFHKQRGFYKKHFLPFRQALKHNKAVTIQHSITYAEKHNLVVHTTTRTPEFIANNAKINYLPSNGRRRNGSNQDH